MTVVDNQRINSQTILAFYFIPTTEVVGYIVGVAWACFDICNTNVPRMNSWVRFAL